VSYAVGKKLMKMFEGKPESTCSISNHSKWHFRQALYGEQGWRSGESVRLPPMCPGFDWVEFVVGFLLCSESFFSGCSGFLLSSKTNISKFRFDLEVRQFSGIFTSLS